MRAGVRFTGTTAGVAETGGGSSLTVAIGGGTVGAVLTVGALASAASAPAAGGRE